VVPEVLRVSALEPQGDGTWKALTPMTGGTHYRKCENYAEHAVCNWMVPAASGKRFCIACAFNKVIPNLSREDYVRRWYRLERSKRRLVYSLLKLGLPLYTKSEDPEQGLAFSFISDLDATGNERVVTGHANGHITISVDEADPATRERFRVDLNENYRTLLGHFRHEIGHYYWDRLIRDSGYIERFREFFGDERDDYQSALDSYYANGAPADWQSRFLSRYASAHPWEDWAETWAHYLHIIDTLETAEHFGVEVDLDSPGVRHRSAPRFNAYRFDDFDTIIEQWVPLTHALNSLNRSMGLPDLYPFSLSDAAIRKLGFVHEVVVSNRRYDVGYKKAQDIDRTGIVAGLAYLAGVLLGRIFRRR
jgi:hypothetical protein